jgi:hypothetical protein
MTWVAARTHDEGKSGEVEDVAQMMSDALDTASLSLFSFCSGWPAIHLNDTAGKRGSKCCLSMSTRELRVRLMTVHDLMEGKDLRWRSR